MTVFVTFILSTLETECQSSATLRFDILFLGYDMNVTTQASNIDIMFSIMICSIPDPERTEHRQSAYYYVRGIEVDIDKPVNLRPFLLY